MKLVKKYIGKDKKGKNIIRVVLDMTRFESYLLEDALIDFRDDRSDTQTWDSGVDGIVVDQMIHNLIRINTYDDIE